MAKPKKQHRCTKCNYTQVAWFPACPKCEAINTATEELVPVTRTGKAVFDEMPAAQAAAFIDLEAVTASDVDRVDTGIEEFNRVLGGGLVPASIVILSGEPGHGKALALDTPILTTHGWETMGTLVAGDHVYGTDGQPTRIKGVTTVQDQRPCYIVSMLDGERIVADENHVWNVVNIKNQQQLLTTKQLAQYHSSLFIVSPHALQFVGSSSANFEPVTQWILHGQTNDTSVLQQSSAVDRAHALKELPGVRRHATEHHYVLEDVDQGQLQRIKTTAATLGWTVRQQEHDVIFSPASKAWREIVAVEACGNHDVRCIEVENTEGMFLAGYSLLPTHNSTLSTQLMIQLAKAGNNVCYISGEESPAQAKIRFERLGAKFGEYALPVSQERKVEKICQLMEEQDFDLIVIDSIQSLESINSNSINGSVSQVRECAHALEVAAKKTNTAVFLIGQVTKDSTLAGPRSLEHLVDVVLEFEGSRSEQFRIVRAVKNRFGNTDEIGLFEMTSEGLKDITDPTSLFVQQRTIATPGVAICATIEGTRPVLVEIQALVSPSNFPQPIRAARGLDPKRVQMLLGVLQQKTSFRIGSHDIYLNVSGGLKIDEAGIDLAVCAALASAFSNRPVKEHMCLFGEITLPGEVRLASASARRTKEAERLSYKTMDLQQAQKLRTVLHDCLDDEIDDENDDDDD